MDNVPLEGWIAPDIRNYKRRWVLVAKYLLRIETLMGFALKYPERYCSCDFAHCPKGISGNMTCLEGGGQWKRFYNCECIIPGANGIWVGEAESLLPYWHGTAIREISNEEISQLRERDIYGNRQNF